MLNMFIWDPSAHNQKLINNVLNMSIMINFFGSLQFIFLMLLKF